MGDIQKVVIVGGGVGGCAAALAFQRAGIEVEVHEKFEDFQGRATGFSIWAYAIKRLLEFGFHRERLERIGREIVREDIYAQDGELMMSLPVAEASKPVGAPSMDIDRRRLQEEIVHLLGDGVYRFGSEVVAVDQDGSSATVALRDGSTASGDLVIGSDGIHSLIRDTFNDPPDLKVAASAVVEGVAEFDHPWLAGGHHAQVWGRGHRCGVGAVGDGRVRWFVGGIVTPEEPEVDRAELIRRTESLPDIARGVIEATDPNAVVTARIAHAYPVDRWYDGRVVLIGDAAHTLSPYAGMGACSTIEDAARLVELIASSPSIDAALAAYTEQRKAKTREIEKGGRRNEWMMMSTSPTLLHVRNWLFEHTPEDKLHQLATEMATGE